MSDSIKSQLTTAYMMFVFDFADPSTVDQAQIEGSVNQKLEKIFDSQKCADRAKKLWGKTGFRKVLSLYFNQFQVKSGLDYEVLELVLTKNKKIFLRHLGRDKVMFLTLIITLMKALEPQMPRPRKGLLADRISA